MITITEPAQEYLAQLLKKQDTEGVGIRVFILDPGTPKAETCISFCRPGEQKDEDELKEFADFNAWLEKRSIPFLEEAVVDYAKDSMGGQLTIKAPNSRLPKIRDDSPLEDRINYVLYNEINPSLASHGGVVSLEDIVDDSIAILRFGGGCQGCGMVDVTLKEGVEKTLMDQIPGLTGVRDVTDHTNRENAYFK
ncbi:MAG TPA: Fe/S biogenesis protein NfuA [Pseudohongiella sp.]|mgnify:FL=1|nr:Fe/S biogenesis protein NfuA [Pseudohongiella sp.]MAO39463.1 Fe/S biogenesis protein NfuA [Pseudohongiella sp.]MAY56920.1 Fe/S biogenesis protein NfuA [Gammaproteobacteria bacterium]MBJ56397.1 Fe/S biogenesis protein NfuA [Gammaproteobacteria bacterium]HBX36503.1 Fe/S biogenesis protein NfuA [Pseudohongiella sp.]|tara:strand:- start:5352 stop:5933 length:582 start_codon:yes stop_codon:yes gene_type:complete